MNNNSVQLVGDLPFRALPVGKEFTITIKFASYLNSTDVKICYCHKNQWFDCRKHSLNWVKTEDGYDYYTVKIKFNKAYVHYCCFEVKINGEQKYVKRNHDNNDQPEICDGNVFYHWDLTIYEADYTTPDYIKGGIGYQIFVDRFNFSKTYISQPIPSRNYVSWNKMPEWKPDEKGEYHCNDFYRGNIEGIIEKLDYLADLSVTVLYLTPIFYGGSNHRYDTIDYSRIDPDIGDWDALARLQKECEARGMHIMLDMVFNHASNESVYKKDPSKASWILKDQNGNDALWAGYKTLVAFDKSNPGFQEFICGKNGVLRRCIDMGIKCFRFDVAHDLPDYFLEKMRASVGKDVFFLYEVWDYAVNGKKDPEERSYLIGKSADSVMNYRWTDAMIRYMVYGNATYLKYSINKILSDYPKCSIDVLFNFLSSHDIPRILTMLTGNGIKENPKKNFETWEIERGGYWDQSDYFDTYAFRKWEAENETLSVEMYNRVKSMLKSLTLLQYFLPGDPCVYYGDELGLLGYKDPYNRKPMPWENEDTDLLEHYKKIGRVRKYNRDVLATGDIKVVNVDYAKMTFERYTDKAGILVILSRMDCDVEINIPYEYKDAKVIFKLNGSNKNKLTSYGGLILKKSNVKK